MMDDRVTSALALDPDRKRALLASLLRERNSRTRPAKPSSLSFAQRRLWLLDQVEPRAAAYNVPLAYRMSGTLNVAALHGALKELVARHDVLRAVVTEVDGEPAHRVDLLFDLALPIVDLDPADRLEALLARESARRFTLDAAPAIRALIVRVAPAEHVLLLTMHHIVVDGWSVGILNGELAELYRAHIGNRPAALPELRADYSDFVRRQRAALTGDRLERGLRYWRDQLHAAPPQVDFRVRGAGGPRSASGRTRSLTIDRFTAEELQRVAQANGTTLFSTLLAIYFILLERYTGQTDIVVGSAFANRPCVQDETLIGFFVNTLPLRARLSGDPSFAAFLADVHAMTLAALEHGDIPFDMLVEDLKPARGAARTPLVNVMFVLQNAPADGLVLDGLDVTPVAVECTTAKFDLTLEIVASATGLTAAIEYSTDLFDDATIDAMLAAFASLAAAAPASVERPVSRLPLLPPAMQQALCVQRNPARHSLSGERIETRFERQAEVFPDADAIVSEGERLSYRALNERANRLAHHLRARGVGRATSVAVCLERGSAAIVATLAVVKSGGVYVPLDPQYPRDRLRFMLDDSGAAVVLTERRFAERVGDAAAQVVVIDDDRAWRACAATNPGTRGSGEDAAYIMYTSGSTGTPKGVLVAHRGIERLISAPFDLPVGPGDTIAHASSLSFDASTFEIWAALCNGARLAIVAKDVLLAPDVLAATIGKHAVTIMFLTTALFREIVRAAPATFGPLSALIVGGEALDAQSVALLLAAKPPRSFFNAYGPTETTTFATAFAIDVKGAAPDVIPIGRPLANTEAFILDHHLHVLPPGACGQLYVGGAGVALGYVNRPELNASKFVAHPFSGDRTARLYATGDLVRYLPSGDLEFLGRIDGQVKLRGFRIEPGEIESVLRACAGVDDAAVVVREDASGTRRLVGYATAAVPDTLDVNELSHALRAALPAHCIPDTLVVLAALPLTAGGKVDRAALPPPAPRDGAETNTGEPPSELHRQLQRLWEKLLAVRPIGIRDDFFAVGGHSLLAVRLITEMEREFGVRLPLAELFNNPTIEGLAYVLSNDPASFNRSPLITLNAGGGAAPLFFLHASLNGGGYYCLGLAKNIGPDRPLHLLRPHGVDGEPVPQRIEQIAAECLALVTAAQPNGPYLLGGFCSGGLVAYEMARQLARRNELVAHVVLIDVPHPGPPLPAVAGTLERIGRRCGLTPARRAAVERTFSRAAFRLRDRFKKRREPRTLDERWRMLCETYVPPRYDGRVTLFGSAALEPAERSRWLAACANLELRSIDGDHLSCITDHIDTTAASVAAALR